MERLEQVKHRAVVFVEQATRYVYFVIWSDADKILIESAVMDRAKAESIRNVWIALFIQVGHDVGCVE